jgi:hypothetical protein
MTPQHQISSPRLLLHVPLSFQALVLAGGRLFRGWWGYMISRCVRSSHEPSLLLDFFLAVLLAAEELGKALVLRGATVMRTCHYQEVRLLVTL